MNPILAFLLAHWQIVAAAIAAVVGLPLVLGKNPLDLLGSACSALGLGTDTDAEDMKAFRRLEARFVRTKCKEGQDALKVVATHFLSDHTES